jgi:DNA-binding response OmpR family regulator
VTRILIVEDEPALSEPLAFLLQREGYETEIAGDGRAALTVFDRSGADLVLLDLMLPDLDGLEVCRQLRGQSNVPVIMLTALGEEVDRVLGLEVGADDYVTKPFSPRELVLRVQSVLRRTRYQGPGETSSAVLTDGDLVVDVSAREVVREGCALALTTREFDLLVFFLAHPRRAFTREELMEQVWNWHVGDHSTVTVHVRRLREKIEPDPTNPQRLITVWGVGYRWDPAT